MKNYTLPLAVAVVVLGAIILYLVFKDTADAPEVVTSPETTNNTATTTPTTPPSAQTDQTQGQTNSQTQTVTPTQTVKKTIPQSNAVMLPEMKSGGFVTVTSARLTKSGYVVIYRTNSKEETIIIGHSQLLTAGTYTNLSIQLTTPVVRGQVVIAVLHADDGDGEYEFPVSDSYLPNGTTKIVYDVDVVDIPVADEAGMINGSIEDYLKDARDSAAEN